MDKLALLICAVLLILICVIFSAIATYWQQPSVQSTWQDIIDNHPDRIWKYFVDACKESLGGRMDGVPIIDVGIDK